MSPIGKPNLEEENRESLEFVEEVTKHADEVQRRVLTEILTQNANVEYLQRHGFNCSENDHHVFKTMIPVVTYEDLVPYIHRIANGDSSSILTSQPITGFLTSSGTSGGERKLIPITEEDFSRRIKLHGLSNPVISQNLPGVLENGKRMELLFTKSEATTPGGLLAQPLLTTYHKSKHFLKRPFHPYTNLTSPNDTILCPDSDQSMYTQILCGLYQNKEVVVIGGSMASLVIRGIKFLETHWEILCNDIRFGSLNPRVSDPNSRDAVLQMIKPDPILADFVKFECTRNSWKGIVTRLWPNVKYVQAIATGTMAQYIETLDYYTNGLPIVTTSYASSECSFGINLDPFCKQSQVAFTIFPHVAFFEFLPVNENGEEVVKGDKLVDLVDVKLGKEYEIVVTNYSGLFRYRVGDILRVAGFKNKAPQFTFVRRRDVGLSIDSDKTSEAELQTAVNNAVGGHLLTYNTHLHDYTSYVDTKTIPGHYVLFWEIVTQYDSNNSSVKPIPALVLEECCLAIEESLSSVYRQGRAADKSIGALEIRVVEKGAFDHLMDFAINSRGASMSQYKTPRCVKYAPIIELLNAKVVSSHFSQKYPKWVPGHKNWYTNNITK